MMKITIRPSIPVEAESLQKLIAYSAIIRTTVSLFLFAWLVLQGTSIVWAAGGMSLALLAALVISWEAWKNAWDSATTRQRNWLAAFTLAQVFLFTLVLTGVIQLCLSRLLDKDLVSLLWFPVR